MKFSFKKLALEDLPLLFRWYHSSHVLKWYGKKKLDYASFLDKYKKYISQELEIFGFICYLNKKPLGYIQYYSAKRHQWADHAMSSMMEKAAGIDLFIGDKAQLGRGIGPIMIRRFLKSRVFTKFKYCFVDPEIENKNAIACYEKAGFAILKKVSLDLRTKAFLMMKPKS